MGRSSRGGPRGGPFPGEVLPAVDYPCWGLLEEAVGEAQGQALGHQLLDLLPESMKHPAVCLLVCLCIVGCMQSRDTHSQDCPLIELPTSPSNHACLPLFIVCACTGFCGHLRYPSNHELQWNLPGPSVVHPNQVTPCYSAPWAAWMDLMYARWVRHWHH